MNYKYGQIIKPDVYQKILGVEHYMKKYQGFGCSEKELMSLIKDGVKIMQIIYIKKSKEEHIVYITSPKQFIQEGIKDEVIEGDVQYFLKEKQMVRC